MKYVVIADDKRGKEPVTEMHEIIVVKVVSKILPSHLTVFFISMHLFGQWLIQKGVQISDKSPPLLRPQTQHEDEPAEVHLGERDCHTI